MNRIKVFALELYDEYCLLVYRLYKAAELLVQQYSVARNQEQ